MPRTSSGQNEDAAIANAQPTSTPAEKFSTSSDAATATAPAATAHQRKERTPPPRTSCDSAPATLTSSPDEVDRNAAKAPAATSAASAAPSAPGSRRVGSASTIPSVLPVRYSWGARSLPMTPRAAVPVGIEPHQDVRQPDRAEERGHDQAVGRRQRMGAVWSHGDEG